MFKSFLDSLPSFPVIFLGGIFFFMPILPEPHLWEKAMMIKDGLDMAPIDYFDIFLHGGAGIIALAKAVRVRRLMRMAPASAAVTDRGADDANDHTDDTPPDDAPNDDAVR